MCSHLSWGSILLPRLLGKSRCVWNSKRRTKLTSLWYAGQCGWWFRVVSSSRLWRRTLIYIVLVYGIEKCRVQVFRFDGTNKSWVVINDIGNHIFFISKTSCCSIVPSDPTMRNRIYLSKIEGNDMVFYSLDTKMYHILGSGDSRTDLYGTNQPLMCCWV